MFGIDYNKKCIWTLMLRTGDRKIEERRGRAGKRGRMSKKMRKQKEWKRKEWQKKELKKEGISGKGVTEKGVQKKGVKEWKWK